MPGEFLNTVFSARKFGLCLVSDIIQALAKFPEKHEVDNPTYEWVYSTNEIDEWLETWFSEFIEKGDKDE